MYLSIKGSVHDDVSHHPVLRAYPAGSACSVATSARSSKIPAALPAIMALPQLPNSERRNTLVRHAKNICLHLVPGIAALPRRRSPALQCSSRLGTPLLRCSSNKHIQSQCFPTAHGQNGLGYGPRKNPATPRAFQESPGRFGRLDGVRKTSPHIPAGPLSARAIICG